jgi:hypothetical protein
MAERALLGALLLGGTLLSVLAQGFALPSGINAYHWPILFGWADSSEGPHDAFVLSLEHFVTWVWPALALMTTEENWPWLLPLVHLLTRLATAALLFALLDQLLPGRRRQAALLAATLVAGVAFWIGSPLGHGEVLLDSLSHSSLNPPLALAVWLAALRRRWWLAALLLGLLVNVNAFVAAWLGLALAAGLLWQRRSGGGAGWRQVIGPLLLLALLTLPTAWRILETLRATAPRLPDYDFRDFLRAYYPGHFFAGWTAWAEWQVFLLLLLGQGWLLVTLAGRIARPDRALLGGSALGLLAVVGFGVILPALSASRLLLNAHPLRLDFLLVWLFYLLFATWSLGRPRFGAPLLAAWIALFAGFWLPLALLPALVERPAGGRRPPLALLALALALLVAAGGTLPALAGLPRLAGALLLALFLLALLAARRDLGAGGVAALAGLAALQLVAATGLAAPSWLLGIGLLLGFAAAVLWPGARWPALLALALTLVAAWSVRETSAAALLLLAAAAAGGLALPPWPAALAARLAQPRLAPALLVAAALAAALPGAWHLARTGHLDRYDARALDFLALQRWARQATPPESLFLVPDEQLRANLVPSFWTLSRRRAWVDWRMGAATHWLPDFWWHWSARMQQAEGLRGADRKLAFARAEGIGFVILERAEPLPEGAVPAYENPSYRVLAVAP